MWRVLIATGVIVLYRYSLRLSTPQSDWWYLEEYGSRLQRWLRVEGAMLRAWIIGLCRYVPTPSVKSQWERLQARYISGNFGEAGT